MKGVEDYLRRLDAFNPVKWTGRITKVLGTTLECEGFRSSVGDLCRVYSIQGTRPIFAEVVGFREGRAILMPLSNLHGVGPGSQVTQWRKPLGVRVGDFLLGRVLDGLGHPIDGCGPLPEDAEEWPLLRDSPQPLSREPVVRQLGSGIAAIDALIPIGRGQRMGIFAGSGVGKSTLLGMIAKRSEADVNVIGLIGERGIEVRGFIEKVLGTAGLERSVIVVATSDTPAQQRFKGAFLTITIAEYFREQGLQVMMMMDSVTRLAAAIREIGLSRGEPPTVKGYPPSFYALLPQVVERLGATSQGSVTGLYTVLVEGDDMNDPVADTMRSLLDGHIVLSRDLANKGHFPAIDVLSSTSRVMSDIVDRDHLELARRFREVRATYDRNEDLINIGAYKSGTNPDIDRAIRAHAPMTDFLRQGAGDAFPPAEVRRRLERLIASAYSPAASGTEASS